MTLQRFCWLHGMLVMLLLTSGLKAQVTVGSNNSPEKAALLDIKEKIDKTGGPTVDKGGLLLPRVNLEKKYQLYPFVREAGYNPSNYDNSTYNPDDMDPEYASEKLAHIGLIVYNLVADDENELCLGLNQWDGEKWNCFQEKMGNAIATITNCDSLNFYGQYQNKVSLNSSNYVTIPLLVTKSGAYTVTIMPDPDNGYYFTASGIFMTTGYYFITVPGAGTPIDYTPATGAGSDGDLMKIVFNGKPLSSCDPLYVKVEDSSKKPLYSMDCSKTKVRGVYKIDVPLDTDEHYIDMVLTVDAEALGATYIIETNTVDGIYFKAEGTLNNTSQPVKLLGYGVPNSMDDKVFTITSNSKKTVATCKATVYMCYTPKKILGIGYYNTNYGYYIQNSASLAVMNADINFGSLENSTVKVEKPFSYSYIKGETQGNIDGAGYINASALSTELAKNPDIVVLGFFVSFNANTIQQLTEYLNKGGVLVMFTEYYTSNAVSAEALFRNIFADSNITGGMKNARSAVYPLSSVNDEILNGPFGDARGKLWGEDASQTYVIQGLPAGDIYTYSGGSRLNATGANILPGVTMFRHKTLNLFWVGDGGFNSNLGPYYGNTYLDKGICPFTINSSMQPIPRVDYGESAMGNVNQTVYNSILFGNIMAWAIKQAEFNGINTVK